MDRAVRESFDGAPPEIRDRRAELRFRALVRAFTAILLLVVGVSLAGVGFGIVFGTGFGLGVAGVLLFQLGLKIGDSS